MHAYLMCIEPQILSYFPFIFPSLFWRVGGNCFSNWWKKEKKGKRNCLSNEFNFNFDTCFLFLKTKNIIYSQKSPLGKDQTKLIKKNWKGETLQKETYKMSKVKANTSNWEIEKKKHKRRIKDWRLQSPLST